MDQVVVHSLFDDAFYAPQHPFSAADVTTLGDISSVPSWVFNGTSRIDGPLGPATTSHAAYLVRLAGACGAADRTVWLQEVGAPLPDVPIDAAPEFVRHTVEAARATDRQVAQSIPLPADIVSDPAGRSLVAPRSDFHRAWVALGRASADGFTPPLITPVLHE